MAASSTLARTHWRSLIRVRCILFVRWTKSWCLSVFCTVHRLKPPPTSAAKSRAAPKWLENNIMGEVIDAIKGHHRELLSHLIEGTESLAEGDLAQLEAFVQFLKADLLPHASGEEVHLYPAVDRLVRDHGRATATMSVDHEFISRYVQELEQAGNEVRRAAPADRSELARRVAHLAIGLEALMKVHLEKEERVYLPLVEQYISISEQQRVLDGMHAA